MKGFNFYGPLCLFRRSILLACVLVFPSIISAAPATLSVTDKDSSISLSADRLGVTYSGGANHRGVRSEQAIQPGSGFYYYEGHREIGVDNMGFGVATSLASLQNYGGYGTQSIGINALGYVYYNRTNQLGPANTSITAADTFGIAVDYRGVNPIVYLIASNTLMFTQVMDQVTEPLNILVYGHENTLGVQQTINTASDLINAPFIYDVRTILSNAGITGTTDIIDGWESVPPVTQIVIDMPSQSVVVGQSISLTVTATNVAGDDISSMTNWSTDTGLSATGGVFTLSDTTLTTHIVTAQVMDELGQPVTAFVTIQFVDLDTDNDGLSDTQETALGTDPLIADSDADGLSDGDEVNTHGTNPLNADSDVDGLSDFYEVNNGLNPLDAADALLDPDSDGYSNLDESQQGTDPQNAFSYPNSPARLSDSDKDPSISLSADRLGVTYSGGANHRGVRSEQAIQPGSGFYYYEGHREIGVDNMGFGVATSLASLQNYGGYGTQSIGINALGYVYYNRTNQLGSANSSITAADTFGIAVDYRGVNPIVYLIASNTLMFTQVMDQVTDPLNILVYGHENTLGVQQTINTASDLINTPFVYDVRTILSSAGITGTESIYNGWIAQTTINMTSLVETADVGSDLILTAIAKNSQGVDISNTISWLDTTSGVAGNGASFTVTSSAIGSHTVIAEVLNESGFPVKTTSVINFTAVDTDKDGITDDVELTIGTDPFNKDSDADGLSDGEEVNQYLTNPLATDSDLDGIDDGYEIGHASNPLVDDSALDTDNDGFSNLDEYTNNTNSNNPNSYPGGPAETRLNSADKFTTVSVDSSGLFATFTESNARAVRSTEAISAGSGWFYIEAHRELVAGDYGIGVASVNSTLSASAGSDSSSVGLTTDGRVLYNGITQQTYSQIASNEFYGLAVDYTGSTPVIYPIITGSDGFELLLNPVSLLDVTGDLYVVAFGSGAAGSTAQISINAGDDPSNAPFHYPANYLMFNAGYAGAEFMGTGWGAVHTYNGRPTAKQFSVAQLELDGTQGSGITLSPDNLSAAYEFDEKMAIRANQGMIGEFRYFEAHRLLDTLVRGGNYSYGAGQGVTTKYGRLNPYPFDPEQPSMSLNSMIGIWRNLNFIADYDLSAYYYGFVVDYRDARPVVHVLLFNEVIHTMVLPDVFTPLHPMLYANTQGQDVLTNRINFGATPFKFNPKLALERAGINTTGFVSGWGDVNKDSDSDNLRDSDEVIYGTNPLVADSDGDGLLDGNEIFVHNTSAISSDTDNDGMPDGYEIQLGQDALINDANADIDSDGITNIDEFSAGTGIINEAPELSILEQNFTLNLGESLTVTATVTDIIDGDLSSAVNWSDNNSSNTATGLNFSFIPTVGIHQLTASVTDSGGLTSTVSIIVTVVDPTQIDSDSDGLTDNVEITLGTDINNADTDADGLADGTEVNLYFTNPLSADSDSDLIPDGYEITNNMSPLDAADALLDNDSDGRSNLQEYLDGTNPNVADPAPGAEIIIDTNEAGTSQLGNWNNSGGSAHFGAGSLYATAGGSVDSYRFTPNLSFSSNYEVYVWNSCYSNRAINVKHIIQHANGIETIEVDQDCATGVSGEWNLLGTYSFNSGNQGYLEITDEGLTPSSTTYMGADAARFVRVGVIDNIPVISLSNTAITLTAGESLTLTASAMDVEDGDLSGLINWQDDVSGEGAIGASFTFVPSLGFHTITVSITDSNLSTSTATALVTVVASPGLLDEDNDGLNTDAELAAGTDPLNSDSDADGILDGEEVLNLGTNPLSSDTDADGIDDLFEINNGLNPTDPLDALLDADNDGVSNIDEFLAGTDLNQAPAVVNPETIMDTAQGESISGQWNNSGGTDHYGSGSLYAVVGGVVDRFRFTPNLQEASDYQVYVWNSCYSNRAVNVKHTIQHASGIVTIEVDQDCDTGVYGLWNLLGTYSFNAGTTGYLEISDEGLAPLTRTYMGADAARFIRVGEINNLPVISLSETAVTLTEGDQITLTATASDLEDGDLSALLNWHDDVSGLSITGDSFTFTPTLGVHTVTASVVDNNNASSSVFVTLTVVLSAGLLDNDNDALNNDGEAIAGTDVNNPDSDSDGLLDGEEVLTWNTNPLSNDTDADGMDDYFEINNALNPLDSLDAFLDADNDGASNLEEYLAGTDPQVAPITEFVIDTNESGTSQSGNWRNSGGSNHYGTGSLYATAGGVVDRYRFTPDLPQASNYEVYVWNSCYSNRAINVKHIIQHANGIETIEVDQDCDTGIYGQWNLLGTYGFNTGTTGYLEITDEGLVPSSTTYMGADAARFVAVQ